MLRANFGINHTRDFQEFITNCQNLSQSTKKNIRKYIDCERASSEKRMNRVQNSQIEISKWIYNQVRLVIAAFVYTCLY